MRRRRKDDRRKLLAEDARRLAGFAQAVIDEAERLDVPVSPILYFTVAVWRSWSRSLSN
jgi:hypothetical protein